MKEKIIDKIEIKNNDLICNVWSLYLIKKNNYAYAYGFNRIYERIVIKKNKCYLELYIIEE